MCVQALRKANRQLELDKAEYERKVSVMDGENATMQALVNRLLEEQVGRIGRQAIYFLRFASCNHHV